jgi:hypothetical protein
MTAPEGYQWRRDKDGLGVWEPSRQGRSGRFRTFAGRPSLGRRLGRDDKFSSSPRRRGPRACP